MYEVEMAEDLKELVAKNADVKISKEMLSLLDSLHDMDLVMIETEIDHGIIIKSIEIITEEYIEKHLLGTHA